jgi:hypothetical protein
MTRIVDKSKPSECHNEYQLVMFPSSSSNQNLMCSVDK